MAKSKYKKRADGRYLYQMTIGKDKDGKRILKNIYAETVKELENKIAETKSEFNKGKLVTESVTVNELCDMLLKSKSGQSMKTNKMYKDIINKYVRTEFGERHIKDIRPHDLQNKIHEMRKTGIGRTIEMWYLTIKQLFDMALKNGWCNSLPYTSLQLPSRQKQPKTPLTENEISLICNSDLTQKQKVFVYFGLMCGLRKGEILALTTDDVFLDNIPVVKIRNNNIDGKIQPYPKSQSGNREVPIPNKLAKVLVEYVPTLDSKILVPQEKYPHKYSTESSYKSFWQKIIKNTSLDITAHILRHTYATRLYYAGVDIKTAQYLLGHATLQMTLGIYTHLDEKEKAKQTTKIFTLFD